MLYCLKSKHIDNDNIKIKQCKIIIVIIIIMMQKMILWCKIFFKVYMLNCRQKLFLMHERKNKITSNDPE